ncbi:hypothetical protein NUV89_10620 [Pseudomonas sp. 18.1.10]|uniref:terpene synthase family protein n=1 Tax=Pseudomonas sp. 18.1.10 TaxID=2969302 RepID=UPI002150290A|nr:hypothetical protein [Pseudomonas sp. 18.1.10]MCR4538846.1 hypothetical protein [Pseudomonas sp. 18.1.10]
MHSVWQQPATSPLSPYTDQAQQHTRQWLKNMGLEATPHAAHQMDIYLPGTYAGYLWCDAPLDILLILSDLLGWFSCQDDFADEDCTDPKAMERVLREVYACAFTSDSRSREPLARGLADIVRRAARLMPPQWKQRLAEQYATYLLPCCTALMHRLHHTQPAVDGYECQWRNAGGFQVCTEFNYLVHNIHLPSSAYYSGPWQELRNLALNLCKAVNDLLSYAILETPDDDSYNLITHLRHHPGYSSERAAEEVTLRIEQWADRFANAQQHLPVRLAELGYDACTQEQMRVCAQALHQQWRGNIAWHWVAPRYGQNCSPLTPSPPQPPSGC